MLYQLSVENLGIIKDMNWRLSNGLNVITGETGAGKSLVIDALESLLTGKAGDEVIRHGADEVKVEGIFTLSQSNNLSPLMELLIQKGLVDDGENLALSCRFRRKGKNVIKANGHPVTKDLLQKIGRLLVDIHGQSDHLSLLDSNRHLDFLDSYAHSLDLRNSVGAKASEIHRTEQEIKALKKDEADRTKHEELLRFQIDEISRAKLREGEEEELETERNILSSTEKLKTISYEAYRIINEEDVSANATSALDRLEEAAQMLRDLSALDPSMEKKCNYLEEVICGITETARELRTYGDSLEYDPNRLEEIESRLELVRNMKRKYGKTVTEVISHLTKMETELDDACSSDERRIQLEEALASLKQETGRLAHQLSKKRNQAARSLVGEVEKELQDLNMAQVKFEVSIQQETAEEGIPFPDGKSYNFTNKGADIVEFMASTNPGEPLKPLAKIASTGEISRFTLALKSVLSEADSIPVVVFDEIDIGIGGRSGEIIGRKLWGLSRNSQVICVTHLPQIVAFADAHFRIHKEASGDRTLAILEELDGESRVQEMAAMLSGPQCTEASLDNARELVNKVQIWKETLP